MTQKDIDRKDASDTKKDEFEKLEDATFFSFKEIGDTIEGMLLDKGKSETYGFGIYDIKTPENEYKRFHGSQQLDSMMISANMGDYIRVTYIDTQNLPKGTLKIFNVERKK